MLKDKKYLFIFVIVFVVTIAVSYLIYDGGITSKLNASVNKLSNDINKNDNASFHPKFDMVINSSGERFVNDDISITIIANSIYNIDKIYYSFDKNNWKEEILKPSNDINYSLIFKESMNKNLYIKLENEKGYQSSIYETYLKIDKKKPEIILRGNGKNTLVKLNDDNEVKYVQYSYDGMNFISEEINEKSFVVSNDYNYVRIVDIAGNISDIKKIK